MVLLFVAIASAVLCGYVARAKGFSVGLWAVLGFILPLLALIALAALPAKPVRGMHGGEPIDAEDREVRELIRRLKAKGS